VVDVIGREVLQRRDQQAYGQREPQRSPQSDEPRRVPGRLSIEAPLHRDARGLDARREVGAASSHDEKRSHECDVSNPDHATSLRSNHSAAPLSLDA
jgi:hypothetical protein